MRTIKFRGKRIDNGEWVYGELCTPRLFDSKRGYFGKDVPCIFCDEGNVPIIPESVGQFTGLFDKNIRGIYEGDVVVYGSHCKHIVEFKHGMFGYTLMDGWFVGYGGNSNFTFNPLDKSNEHEVIGNIHDNNPELLNEK